MLSAVRPAWWLTNLKSDIFPTPSGTESLKKGLQYFKDTENDYHNLKAGRRPFGVPLPGDTELLTPQPNDPGPQPQGTAKLIDGQQ